MTARGLVAASFVLAVCAATGVAQTPVFDLRLVVGTHVLARPGALPGRAGEPVRVVLEGERACDTTMAADEAFSAVDVVGDPHEATGAPLRGCTGLAVGAPLFAIVHPAPAATWPRALPASDPRGALVIEAAPAAAASAGHLRGEIAWDAPRLYTHAEAVVALVTGPACADASCSPTVAAVARVREGHPIEVVIARPAHGLWPREELTDGTFRWLGLTDVDGDGVPELLESQRGEGARMLRLVREGRREEGEVVWLASYRDDPTSAEVGHAPRPAPVVRR